VRLIRDGLVYTNQQTGTVDEWLFDEARDPAEQHNLAGERPADLARMQQLAEAQRGDDIGFRSSLEGKKRAPRLDPILVEQLRQLGYAQ
jgi:hypothetical protein